MGDLTTASFSPSLVLSVVEEAIKEDEGLALDLNGSVCVSLEVKQ